MRQWSERAVVLDVSWHEKAPPPSMALRIIRGSGLVCDLSLNPLGRLTAHGDASADFFFNVRSRGKGRLTAEAFGPSLHDEYESEQT